MLVAIAGVGGVYLFLSHARERANSDTLPLVPLLRQVHNVLLEVYRRCLRLQETLLVVYLQVRTPQGILHFF